MNTKETKNSDQFNTIFAFARNMQDHLSIPPRMKLCTRQGQFWGIPPNFIHNPQPINEMKYFSFHLYNLVNKLGHSGGAKPYSTHHPHPPPHPNAQHPHIHPLIHRHPTTYPPTSSTHSFTRTNTTPCPHAQTPAPT